MILDKKYAFLASGYILSIALGMNPPGQAMHDESQPELARSYHHQQFRSAADRNPYGLTSCKIGNGGHDCPNYVWNKHTFLPHLTFDWLMPKQDYVEWVPNQTYKGIEHSVSESVEIAKILIANSYFPLKVKEEMSLEYLIDRCPACKQAWCDQNNPYPTSLRELLNKTTNNNIIIFNSFNTTNSYNTNKTKVNVKTNISLWSM